MCNSYESLSEAFKDRKILAALIAGRLDPTNRLIKIEDVLDHALAVGLLVIWDELEGALHRHAQLSEFVAHCRARKDQQQSENG
jgi:hypothetical protein